MGNARVVLLQMMTRARMSKSPAQRKDGVCRIAADLSVDGHGFVAVHGQTNMTRTLPYNDKVELGSFASS